MYKPIFTIFLVALLISGCSAINNEAEPNLDTENSSNQISENNENDIQFEAIDPKVTALDVLNLLKLKDLPRLAAYAHPTDGVRFSPYGYVNIETDVIIQATTLQNALKEEIIREWGTYDGSGDPIKLSFAAYYEEFIYDHDYVNTAQVSYNQPIGSGNTTNNASEIYPDSFIAEYHYKGTAANEFMDWSSLRIVFTEHNKVWVIVGIIHDQWTI